MSSTSAHVSRVCIDADLTIGVGAYTATIRSDARQLRVDLPSLFVGFQMWRHARRYALPSWVSSFAKRWIGCVDETRIYTNNRLVASVVFDGNSRSTRRVYWQNILLSLWLPGSQHST